MTLTDTDKLVQDIKNSKELSFTERTKFLNIIGYQPIIIASRENVKICCRTTCEECSIFDGKKCRYVSDEDFLE